MITPYNTGKIKIGSQYQAPVEAWFPTRTEAMLQDALLTRKPTATSAHNGITIVLALVVVLVAAIAGTWLGGAL